MNAIILSVLTTRQTAVNEGSKSKPLHDPSSVQNEMMIIVIRNLPKRNVKNNNERKS